MPSASGNTAVTLQARSFATPEERLAQDGAEIEVFFVKLFLIPQREAVMTEHVRSIFRFHVSNEGFRLFFVLRS